MIRAKICGLCRPTDASMANAAGADLGGVILAPGGPRSQTMGSAERIFWAAGGLKRVGVFVDQAVPEVCRLARALRLDVVQLHGAESASVVAEVRGAGPWRVWKAVRPLRAPELVEAVDRYGEHVDAILLDGWSRTGAGGTGARAPWRRLEPARSRIPDGIELVLAGGLTAALVPEAASILRPDVVDVSSGVERAVGMKHPGLVRAFVRAAHDAVVEGDSTTEEGT